LTTVIDVPNDVDELRQRALAHRWYHTIELAPGLVTPGWFDTRSVPETIGLPLTFEGLRCLDVGTFDGYWAFEMERRGAAEVVAIDVLDPRAWDWPHGSDERVVEEMATMKAGGAGFELAAAALSSKVQRLDLSVYDLDPAQVGHFDFAYVGSLLLHLRDPVGALERIRAVANDHVLVVDAIDHELTMVLRRRPVATFDGVGRPWWWKPNVAGLEAMVRSSGMRLTRPSVRFWMPAGAGQPKAPIPWRALRTRQGRLARVNARRGDPHAAVHAAVA
jgi:tRNA (mo5U34)-methyltransferase